MQDVSIRPASLADVPAMLDIYAPYVLETAVSFEYDRPSGKEFASRLKRLLPTHPWLVAEQQGTLLGYAYASPFHPRAAYGWCVETSIYLARERRRQGVGRRLYTALERCLEKQNLLVAYACIAACRREDDFLDDSSIRFHERCGFRPVGYFPDCGWKFDRWYDMVWMEKRLGPLPERPLPMRTPLSGLA